jgi:hypothetical protein
MKMPPPDSSPRKITLPEWDVRHGELRQAGLREPSYGGPLSRHLADGDTRLQQLSFDNSPAALRLWNFLLSEEDRLRQARAKGKFIVGAMKDLGTVPVLAWSFPNVVAFYPDGAWWIPCVMEHSADVLDIADRLGIDESFCPVRAMLGAFVNEEHFPRPDLLTCNVGACCDDFSAIAQRLEALGHNILWWEQPPFRPPDPDEETVALADGTAAPAAQARFIASEFRRIADTLSVRCGTTMDDAMLSDGIRTANRIRAVLRELRRRVFTAPRCPLPALELMIAEMLIIHFCSDRDESERVLRELLAEVDRRIGQDVGLMPPEAVRVYWVNPVADLRAMNLMEECGLRLCGTDFMFPHALDPISEGHPPFLALALAAMGDPMAGPVARRAERIAREAHELRSEAVIVSRIPGASHCAFEAAAIRDIIRQRCDLPLHEIEVPPSTDAARPALRTRFEALAETVRRNRG